MQPIRANRVGAAQVAGHGDGSALHRPLGSPMLALDRIRDDRFLLYTRKTGQQVYLPLHPELKPALETLPAPRGEPVPTHFLWNGISTVHSEVNVAERRLQRVFELSGVKGAHSHRFRHTLATDSS